MDAEARFQKYGYVAGKAFLSTALAAAPELLSLSGRMAVPKSMISLIDIQEPSNYYRRWAQRAEENEDFDAAAWFTAMADNKGSGVLHH